MKIIGYLCPNMEAILLAEYVLSVISTPIPSIRKWPYSCNCQKKTTISISFAKIVFPPTFFSNFFFCEIGSKFVSAGRGSDHLSTLHSLQSDKPELKDISCYLEERKRIPRIMISIEYIVYIGISGDTDPKKSC